jgi:ribose transport system permease protein
MDEPKKEFNTTKAPGGVSKAWHAIVSDYGIVFVVLGLIIVLSLLTDKFFSLSNLMNVLRQISMIAIIAVGAFYTMVGGGIDISLGSVVGLTGIVFAMAITSWMIPWPIAIIITLLIGCTCGLINGLVVSRVGVPPFIVTLGMMEVARGITYVITNAYPITIKNSAVEAIGRGYIFEYIPIPVVIMLVVFFLAHFISQRTRFGRFVYAIGGNKEAAFLSGIKVKRVQSYTFVISSGLAALSGMILASRLASGQPNGGIGWEFEAITGAVIGGVSINGGKGKIFGVLFGAIVIGLLTNGMTLMNVNSFWQKIIKGLVLVAAVSFDVIKTRRANSKV